MEAIQQLLQSTGLSPDELIRKLAEFKAISEKTQCGNDINKNLPDVANGNGERSECANVTSTSDTVIKNELRTNEVVDTGCVVTGDGCCVSTTELCNNEEWKVKCVEDVEDDRLNLESNSNIKIDKPPPAITNEEKVISDKSKCIIEPAKQDCKNNDTKDTDQRNVSIGDKLDETSVNISETTLLNNNLSLTQLNDETLEYRPIEKAETILTSDANTATRNSVKSMEKQQISIEQQTSVVPRCDKSSSDKTEIEVCTHSRGSSDDLEDSFTEELQLTLDDFEDKVSGNEGVELHSSLGKSIRKSVEDDRKFVNLTNDIIVIDDDEDQSKNTLVDDDESQSHVILDKTLMDEDIESFSSDKTILPTENVDEQSNSSTILCTIDSDTDSSLIGHKQNTQCDDSDISQTTEIFSCDRLGYEIKNEEEKEDVLMCSKSPGSDTQERVEKVDAVSKTTENTESLEQNENNMDSNMSSQISISDKGNTDKNSESNTDDAIQMPEKDIESVVTSASDALKDIDNNSESSNHVLNDNECVKTSVNTVENKSRKCEEISILQNNISSSDKTLEYPLQTENVDDKSISSTTAKTIEYSSKRDQNIDSNSIMPSSSQIFNCNRLDEFVLEKPEINMENTSSEPTQEETIVNITHSDIKIEKEQIIELNSEGETDKNIDKSPDLVDEENTLKCDEVINWESGDDNSPKKCVNGDISKHSKSNIPELLSISDYSKQAKHQVKNISVNKVTLINTNNDAFGKTKISNNSLNSLKDITLNVMRNGKVLEGPKSLTRKFLVNHVESTNANNKTQIKITIIKKAPLVETNTSGTIASKQDHSKFAEGLKECSSVKSNNNTNDCRNDGESDGKTNSGESNAEKDVVKRDYDDINKRINNDINKNHDEKDLNVTVMKNIDLMKLIVGRICKSQISNQDSETESINKDKTQEILENAPLTSDKLQDDLNNFPSSALTDLDNQEKSCTSDDIDLTMMEDEEPCGLLDDSDYIDDDDYIKKEVDSGEGPSVSYGSIYPKSTIIDNTLTYKTNSPTTHRPLMGCIRKRKEPTVCTTPVKKPCIDDNDDIYEDAEEQIEDPVNMREKLFNQLQQLRQRKVNDTPLINIAHQIPNTYMKRKNVIKTEEENGIGSTLGIKIVDVRGGVEIDKMCNKDVSPIKLTKTQDITKIKGWRKKKLFVENSAKPNNDVQKKEDSNESSGEGCSYSMKEVSKKCDEALNVFASNNLEGFLEEQRSLNISYDVPNLESSKHEIDYLDSTVFIHEPSGKCLEKKRQYVLAENEDSNTLKQNVKTDASKPRTLAEKRKLLNKSEDNDDSMIRSSIYYNGARYIIPSKYKKTIYIGSHRKTKKKYKFVPVDERRRHKPSILNKETVDEKPKVFYKPGPLCKKQFLQQSCNEDWESVLIKLPAISVAIKPESTKPVHPIVRPFVKFDTFEINENRADFALSALIDNKNKQKFTFKVDYERDQQEILMRKRILKNSIKTQPGDTEDNSLPENVNRVIATMMDDLIRCVENSEIENKIIQEDPDYAPYIEDMVIPSKYKEKKVKRQIIKGSARRTNLELKRLNVKVIEVNIEDDHQPIVDCKKPFCKLGCVCHSLDKTTLPSDHCGNHHCIFKCKCSKRKDTLKFVLPSGTDLLSECTVNKLENEAKKDLAKVEKEFTQTVIHANNKTIVFGNSNERKRRSLKQPKKYEDYIETSIIAEDLCEKIVAAPVLVKKPRPEMKPCFVRVEKLNLDHVIPYCWNHNVYDCDCGYKMSKEDLEVHSMQEETMESRLNDLVDSKLMEHTVNITKDSNLNKLEMKRKSQSVDDEDEFIEVSNMAIEETILSQRKSWKSWKSKDVVHCARTMGISTSYYMERNRMKQFKKMLVKKLGLYDGKIDFNKWVEDVEKPAKITKSVNDRLCVQTKPNEPAKASGRRKQHLLTREEVYINEQNKKKIEEDIFHNYPEVYKPSELVIQKFNELLGADKNEENDYRLLQWSTMLQRYEAKVWEIWTAPSETKIRFIITNNKTTSVSGFVNIRTFEELENRSTIKIDFIRWIMLRSSPGDKSPENTLLILKKSNDLWEVCGMCAKNTKNQKMKMFDNGFTATNKVNFSCNFYLKKDLIPITESGEYEEYKKISAALPNTPENTKWKILKINSTFSILQFKRNGVKIKCNELINLIKQAQRGLNTLVINNIFKEYDHKLFGIYITHNHTDKVFIGPYYENESYDFQTLRFLNNKLITTKQYSLLTGNNINPLDEEVWYKQTREHEGTISEISEPIIDLTDKEEIIIHVVDDNDTSETIEECNQIYEIVQSEHVSETESKGDEKVEPLKIKISKRKYELHETVRPSFKSKKRKSGKISDETPKKPKRKNSGNISQPDSLININDLNKDSDNKMDENIFLSESDIQKPSETTMEECEMETSVKLNTNIEPIALNNFNEKDKTKTCIINTSPRSLLKSNQPQRLNVINYKKTVASVEIRYFQMLKKMMVSVGILMQSLTYPIAFKVNFSNELIHGYRSIDQEELAVYMPGCNEPMFFRSQMMATHFLQRTLEKSIIVLPDSFEIKVELVEYADYLNILSKPARSMQQSYFKEVHMIGNFEPITLREFARALTQTHLLKAKRNSEKLNDNYVYYNSVIKKLKDWCGKKAEHDPNVQKLLRAMKRDNFHLALTSLEYIYNRLNEISLCSSNKYNCEQLKLSARNLKKKLQSYRKCPMDSKTSESAEVICLDSDEEQSPVTEAPVLQPEQSILDEQFNSVSAARPELTITPVSEMNTLTDVEPNTDLSDTTIEPINNKNNCFQSLASIATQKSPSNKLAVTVQNGTVVAKPKTLKLLMLPVKKKSPVEKIDLSSFTTNTVSNMLGANLNSRQVMLTKDQLNSLKALSAKSKMNKKVKNETDESSERHADENS